VTGPGNLARVPAPTPTPLPPGVRGRLLGLVREVGKFGTVGGVSFLVDVTIYNVLLQLGLDTALAKTCSTVVATTVAFVGNRFWTWRHRRHAHMGKQYATFFLLNAVGLGISLACLGVSHYWLGGIWPALRGRLADNVSGVLLGNGLGTLFRFWSYRRFVFRDAAPGAPSPVPPAASPVPPATPHGSPEPSPIPRM
jgi:putative flippase GtrA